VSEGLDNTDLYGSLAICGIGTLGLITSHGKQSIEYPDLTEGFAHTGIHLTDTDECSIGDPWSSRNPTVVGDVTLVADAFIAAGEAPAPTRGFRVSTDKGAVTVAAVDRAGAVAAAREKLGKDAIVKSVKAADAVHVDVEV
jgi:hypothetical protein